MAIGISREGLITLAQERGLSRREAESRVAAQERVVRRASAAFAAAAASVTDSKGRVRIDAALPLLGKSLGDAAAAEMTAEWGEKCPEYEAGCPACEAWRLFEGRFGLSVPTCEEVSEAQRAAA